MRRLEVKEGDRYGRLTVVKEIESYKSPKGQVKRQFECLCDCNNMIIVMLSNLRKGNTTSCGCYNIEKIIKRRRTHGHTTNRKRTLTYNSWRCMINRCTNPNVDNYINYGGRKTNPVTVCDRWLYSFDNFLNDMGERPKYTTIERRNNDKGYTPENCYWASLSEQNKNRRPFNNKRKKEHMNSA